VAGPARDLQERSVDRKSVIGTAVDATRGGQIGGSWSVDCSWIYLRGDSVVFAVVARWISLYIDACLLGVWDEFDGPGLASVNGPSKHRQELVTVTHAS
jgi:hypothetical protein